MTDEEFRQLLRELPPEVREWIELILAGRILPKDLWKLIRALLDLVPDRAKLVRLLGELARRGRISQGVVEKAMGYAVEEEAGGTAAAGGVTAGGVLAFLFLLLSLLFLVWRVAAFVIDRNAVAPLAPSGAPCEGDAKAATEEFTAGGWSTWGEQAAFRDALKKAWIMCAARAHRCGGNCGDAGHRCLPNVSVQTVTYHWRGAWTTAEITFRCPCECLDPLEWQRTVDEAAA